MSSRPKNDRSFEPILRSDLDRLAEIALKRLNAALARQREKRRLLAVCLCQGAADHYVHRNTKRDPGVNDFDLWAFFERQPDSPFTNRRASTADFGVSKFGRSKFERPKYIGRRVDVFWRSISIERSETPIGAVARYIATSPNQSPRHLRQKTGVVLWPKAARGKIAWVGEPRPAKSSRS